MAEEGGSPAVTQVQGESVWLGRNQNKGKEKIG